MHSNLIFGQFIGDSLRAGAEGWLLLFPSSHRGSCLPPATLAAPGLRQPRPAGVPRPVAGPHGQHEADPGVWGATVREFLFRNLTCSDNRCRQMDFLQLGLAQHTSVVGIQSDQNLTALPSRVDGRCPWHTLKSIFPLSIHRWLNLRQHTMKQSSIRIKRRVCRWWGRRLECAGNRRIFSHFPPQEDPEVPVLPQVGC